MMSVAAGFCLFFFQAEDGIRDIGVTGVQTCALPILIARLAAHESWANTADPSARTAPARRALLDRFERQVDPDGVLSPVERARRAGHARKAHFTRLALRSAQARRKTPSVDRKSTRLNSSHANISYA